jgi:hypothetical protein
MNEGVAGMLDKPVTVDTKASDDELQKMFHQIADQLRQTGRVESAHFMDIAALVIEEPL